MNKETPPVGKGQQSDKKEALQVSLVTVPADNDCLYWCVLKTCCDKSETVENVRRLCSTLLETSPEFLKLVGYNLQEIKQRKTEIEGKEKGKFWGGYEELLLFSQYFEVEFVVLPARLDFPLQRVFFPSTSKYSKRVYLYWCPVDLDKEWGKGSEVRTVHYNYFARRSESATSSSGGAPLIGMFHDSMHQDSLTLKTIKTVMGSKVSVREIAVGTSPAAAPSALSSSPVPVPARSPLASPQEEEIGKADKTGKTEEDLLRQTFEHPLDVYYKCRCCGAVLKFQTQTQKPSGVETELERMQL